MPKPPIQIDTTTPKKAILRCIEQLEVLTLHPAKRAKLLRKMGGQVASWSKENIRAQRTIDGSPMTPRQRKHKRKAMLSRMRRRLGVFRKDEWSMYVGWKTGEGYIGYQQQYGATHTHTAASREKSQPTPEKNDKPATRTIAKALIAAGYRKPVPRSRGKGRRFARASIGWIQDNMTVAQAGLLVHILRGDPLRRPRRWTSTIPARPFLGVNPTQADQILTDMAREIMRGLN